MLVVREANKTRSNPGTPCWIALLSSNLYGLQYDSLPDELLNDVIRMIRNHYPRCRRNFLATSFCGGQLC